MIAASAGNHALALAHHGHELSIPVVVLMPEVAPLMKVSNNEILNNYIPSLLGRITTDGSSCYSISVVSIRL